MVGVQYLQDRNHRYRYLNSPFVCILDKVGEEFKE